MAAGEDYERRIFEHLSTLWCAKGRPRAKTAKGMEVGEGQVSARFSGEVGFSPGDVEATLDSLGVDSGEFHTGTAGGFHAEHYLARLEQSHERQLKYAKSDMVRRHPRREYTAQRLRRLADELEALRLRKKTPPAGKRSRSCAPTSTPG